MNKRLSKLLASTLVAIMLVFAMPVIIPGARAGDLSGSPPSFYILPDTETFTTASPPPGNMFTVTLYAAAPLTGAPPVFNGSQPGGFSYYVTVGFNTAHLQVVSVAWTNESGTSSYLFAHYGINPGSDWGSVPPFPNHNVTIVMPVLTYNNVAGTVEVGESLLADEYVGAGNASSLCTIKFLMIATPPAGGSLTSLIDPAYGDLIAETYWIDTASTTYDYTTGLSEQACTYTYSWAPPTTKPWLEVANYTENTFDMYTHWIGTTFTECIYINNLDIGWSLTNVTADFVYNGVLLGFVSMQVDPTVWIGSSIISNVPGDLKFEVDHPTSTPYTSVPPTGHGWPLVNVTLQILTQGDVPPQPYGSYLFSVRSLTNVLAYSTLNSGWIGAPVITMAAQGGDLRNIMVFAYLHALPPYLKCTSVTLGPNPVLGQQFTVAVSLEHVTEAAQHLVGIQFRLCYDNTIIEPIGIQPVVEGPWFHIWADQEAALGYPPAFYPPGTFFQAYPEYVAPYGWNVLVGSMLLPNDSAVWNEPLPDGSGILCYITFEVIYQSYGEPSVTTPLTFGDVQAVCLDNMVDQNLMFDLVLSPPINGAVTILVNWPGRAIDLFGGAVNSGWGPLVYPTLDTTGTVTGPYPQFPSPYGGQGTDAPMDLVEPQSWVYLWAVVTENYWPVQHKLVRFEIEEPDGTLYNIYTAFTDENGVAGVGFRMPWPCTDPESLFGVWEVTASVQLADVIIQDDMAFHYDYLVHIWKVTTDAFQYNHGSTVQITIDYGSHAQQTYPVTFVVSLVDELGVTVGMYLFETQVGGTVFCQYKNWTVTVSLRIPKWAYAGIATIHVDAMDQEWDIDFPEGVAVTPEYVGPTIAIQPY